MPQISRTVGVATLVVVLASLALGLSGTAGARTAKASHKKAKLTTVKTRSEPSLTLGVSYAYQLSAGNAGSTAWAVRAHHANVTIIREDASWASIAPATPPPGFNASNPASPGYNWTALDQTVRSLAGAGFKVMLTVARAPKWAEGPGMPGSAPTGSWEPNASAYAQFATAIATRYSGNYPDPLNPGVTLPAVRYWQAWNEPNLSIYLSPTWVQSGGTWVDQSAITYRGLLDAFYPAVKAVSSQNYVITAGTAPYGDDPGTMNRIRPVTFDRDLFCLNSTNQPTGTCPNPAEFDAIDHHPYVSGQNTEGPTWHAAIAGDVSIPDVHEITAVLNAAVANHTVLPATKKSEWVTELAWQTSPPQPQGQGITPTDDGLWAEQALYILWSQGVNDICWYQLGDPPEAPTGWADTYTEGLYYNDGKAKPAAYALRFPFITNRRSKTAVEAWGRAPAAGTVVIQSVSHGKWKSLEQLRVKSGQVFQVPLSLRGKATLRAAVAGIHSLNWRQGA